MRAQLHRVWGELIAISWAENKFEFILWIERDKMHIRLVGSSFDIICPFNWIAV